MDPLELSTEILRKKFVVGTKSRLQRVRETVRRLEADVGDVVALQECMRHFHALAGAAGTYGFPAVSESARDVERRCTILLNQNMAPATREVEQWVRVIRALRRQFGMASSGVVLSDLEDDEEEQCHALVVQAGGLARDRLIKVLAAEGLKVRAAADRASAKRIIRERLPDALIVDTAVQRGTGIQVIEFVRTLPKGDDVAVMLVNSQSGTWDKVKAARFGADALLGRGAVPAQIVSGLRGLLKREREGEDRVLYIESDPDQAAFVTRLLRSSGYRVRVCDDPRNFEAVLEAAKPHLILTEVVLPGIRGFDLVRMIRQDRRYQTTPVLFLTTETQIPARLEGLQAGGDDFLTKPVEPRLLLSTIASRLERARLQASLAERDGLTGLYNHTAFVDHLDRWMQQTDKPEGHCSLALLDIVDMAHINARYGHGAGDQLLRDLATLLKRQARASRLVGRYGGDELAILLYDHDEEETIGLLENMRSAFSNDSHFAPDGRAFRANWYAGVARYQPTLRQPRAWLAQVETALRAAKRGGSRQVVGAGALERGRMDIPQF